MCYAVSLDDVTIASSSVQLEDPIVNDEINDDIDDEINDDVDDEINDDVDDAIVRLPQTLKDLTFGKKFNQEVDFSNLLKLETLVFGDDFNQEVDGKLPESLKTLIFGKSFDKPFNFNKLPNLELLIIYNKGILRRIFFS